jgi:UDP-N-acetylglucosamine 2-epimerase (non-hydrolysing)
MPEEINRLLTDQIADLLFTPSADGNENLAREGVAPAKVHLVGNVMIDTLVRLLPLAEKQDVLARLALQARGYGLVTLHRPSNVDDPSMLLQIMTALNEISQQIPLLFPMHPRTRQRLSYLPLTIDHSTLTIVPPLGYLDFLALQRHAALVITDSGGVQEETTYLGVPCLTVRENTERPITVTLGTNTLVGQDMQRLAAAASDVIAGRARPGQIPPLWDGHAGARIAQVILAAC